jgi:hypothetical protein
MLIRRQSRALSAFTDISGCGGECAELTGNVTPWSRWLVMIR